MQEGKLSVISGPMFAGKTEELIDRIEAAEQKGFVVEVFKPILDIRYAEAHIVSHNGRRCSAHRLRLDAFPLPTGVNVIAIDEAQFLSKDSIPTILNVIAGFGVHVILAGLDLTWKGEPFEPLVTFMAHADEVTKLRARCAVCGKSASRSYRLIQNEETVLVGGAETYEARCLRCFQPSG